MDDVVRIIGVSAIENDLQQLSRQRFEPRKLKSRN